MEKHEIRRKIRALKSMLLETEKELAAEAAFKHLEDTAAFLLADKILIYHSLPDELSTRKFLNKWKSKKRFFLPRVNGVNLEILPYDETRLELGSFHIEEPSGDDVVSVSEIELMIIPGIAFDRKGNRLGRGKGFYDRLMNDTTATKIGIGYDFQIIEHVPTESHDVAVDILISPAGSVVIRTSSQL